MRLKNTEARFEGEDEAIAPAPRWQRGSLNCVVGRELVVERNDDGLFAREVTIEESNADASLFRDYPEGGRFIAPSGDQLHRGGVEAIPGGGSLRSLTRRPPSLSGLDIFSEHVHYY